MPTQSFFRQSITLTGGGMAKNGSPTASMRGGSPRRQTVFHWSVLARNPIWSIIETSTRYGGTTTRNCTATMGINRDARINVMSRQRLGPRSKPEWNSSSSKSRVQLYQQGSFFLTFLLSHRSHSSSRGNATVVEYPVARAFISLEPCPSMVWLSFWWLEGTGSVARLWVCPWLHTCSWLLICFDL